MYIKIYADRHARRTCAVFVFKLFILRASIRSTNSIIHLLRSLKLKLKITNCDLNV